ncbi:hypothetical protein ACFRAU_08205 [Arthrobacter sp. NPDC056691]
MPMSEDPNHRAGSRRWIIREVENSRRRRRTRSWSAASKKT